MRIRHTKTLGIGIAGAVAALLIGSAVAVAGPGLQPAKGLVHGVHADISLIRANGSTDAFTVDRGEVTAKTQTSVTLLRKDGVSVTLGLGADTKVRGAIEVGKGAVAFSRGGTAFAVLAPRGPKPAPLVFGGDQRDQRMGPGPKPRLFGAVHADVTGIKADKSTFSFSFDRGDVTAASPTSVTIKRADGPSVTKTISADTKILGKLVVGGKAAVVSEGSVAKRILAHAPRT